MGPKVMVTTADPFEEATNSGDGHTGSTEMGDPKAMDLSSYQQPMDPDHEEEHDDDDNEGNVSGVSIGTHNLGVVEASVADTVDYDLILGFTELRRLKPTIQWDTGQLEFKTQEQDRPPRRPPEAARAGDLTMRRPTLHGNEFVSAERILREALEDGPIGFMLLEEPPSSLPAFGFVPTGADKGVEMEVEVDKVVTAADIPKPYQHLQDVFDEVEADKLPHHTEHDLHLELIEGGKPPQGPLYLKGPKCHGPGCSRSRRVTGSYGRSTGIEDLVEISREHGCSAVSMETMDSYGLTCKEGPSTATRRTKLKEQAQPRRGPSSRSRHSHEEDQAQMVTTQGA
ncbi:hypothetical protein NDA17_007264 [Ustilago hordei]|nr:hypothetical protein NDA17_007264 [Ustilago hordei]